MPGRWHVILLALTLALSACSPNAQGDRREVLATQTIELIEGTLPPTDPAPSATTLVTPTIDIFTNQANILPTQPSIARTVEALPTVPRIATVTQTPIALATPDTRVPTSTPLPIVAPRIIVAATQVVPTTQLLLAPPTRNAGPAATGRPTPTISPTAAPTSAPVSLGNSTSKHRMVILAFGQSNAGNYGDIRHSSTGNVLNLRNGVLTHASDPLRGAQGNGGSVWPLLGDEIIAAGWYDEVIFVPVAYGGTEMAQWAPELPLFKEIQSAVDDVHGRGLQFTHLLWHHGESDNALNTGWGDYQLRFRNMLRGIRGLGVSAPIFVSVATRCGKYQVNLEIQGAQMNLVNHDAAIWAGPNTDTLDDSFRQEGCHFNDKGQRAIAIQWFEKIRLFEHK